ncbi:hypothetical protein [Flavobacterium sp. '19STA2R22 D10 B1']|uniref:hypothetical protein n=1 Tax=Flavobacterium aerium TaxID=3037261 RepID=UPI00278C7636|nr:hypothetical protein [Flavobacterium sp. '19STA2R22 D10 B1']
MITIKKCSLSLLLFLFCTTVFAQDILNSHSIQLKGNSDNRETFPIVNEANQNVSLFIGDRNKITAYRYNDRFEVIDSMSINRPEKKYNDVIGYNIDEADKTRVFWASSNFSDIYSVQFDFNNRSTTNPSILKLPLKKEKVLQSFTQNNKFYLLSILRGKNQLKLYAFKNDGTFDEHILDFSNYNFADINNNLISFDKVFQRSINNFEGPYTLEKIDTQSANALSVSTKTRKLYNLDNRLIITLDYHYEITRIFTIDLTSLTITEKIITQPEIGKNLASKSNSSIYQDRLYQFKASEDRMAFTVKELSTEKLLKEFNIGREDTITFKNSGIILEGAQMDGSTRELKKTKQFLRKITTASVGVSVYETPSEQLLITLGGAKILEDTVLPNFGALGVLLAFSINTNFTYSGSGYYNYAAKKSIYIDCVFDKEMAHIPSKTTPTIAFDRISTFTKFDKSYDNGAIAETVFKHKDYYVLGYFHRKDKKYVLRRFND